MNYHRKVVVFTLVTTLILLLYSLFAAVYHPTFLSLNLDNISLISEIVHGSAPPSVQDTASTPVAFTDSLPEMPADTTSHGPLPPRVLEKYNIPKTITAFSSDTSLPALPETMRKLHELKQGKKGKVRIAWFGDSMIEGDLLTQTFRKRLQQYFGGFGVGFIPATSLSAPFRTTANHKWTGDWKEENFKTKELTGNLFLSGHLFYTGNGTLNIKDLTVKDSIQLLEKSLICGPVSGSLALSVNGQMHQYNAGKKVNRILLDSSKNHSIEVALANDHVPVYGISMEPQTGVVVDNFSFRGITGLELGKLDTTFLKVLQEENTYDLVVLEYGANLMFRPEDNEYSWYYKHIIPVVRKLQQAMPHTEFLIISTSDRAFRYGEVWKTAIGIDNLVKTQAELAYGNGTAFFNMYKSMGGAGTIVKWADSSTPTLANKDYIHPNLRGADVLGNMFYDVFMKDYNKWTPAPKENDNYVVTQCHTIIDKKTNLEWCIADDKDFTWPEANQWAKNLVTCNGNWSLPTAEQVLTLYNTNSSAGNNYELNGVHYPARISPVFRQIGHGSWVWTNEDIDIKKAYTVNLNQGIKVEAPKSAVSYPVRVMAVRKLKEQKNGF